MRLDIRMKEALHSKAWLSQMVPSLARLSHLRHARVAYGQFSDLFTVKNGFVAQWRQLETLFEG